MAEQPIPVAIGVLPFGTTLSSMTPAIRRVNLLILVAMAVPQLRGVLIRGLQRGSMQNQIGRISQANSVDWPAWAKAWDGVVVIAFLNGVLHRTYEGALGERRARQLSSFVLLVLLTPWAIRTERRHPLPSVPSALRAGLLWSSASVAFEFLFGHYVNKDTWSELFHAYNLLDGRLWLLDVLGIAAAPGLARAWRIRDRSRRPEGLGRLAVGGSVPA